MLVILKKEYKVHRLVADTFISSVKGMEVHHKDKNRSNNNVSNLEVCSKKEHRRKHATTENPVPVTGTTKHGDIVLDDNTVIKICELLVEGYSYPKIRNELNLYDVTDDCIGKIASGKNWKNISCNYNIQVNKRDVMNSYSDNSFNIGLLMNNKFNVHQIGEILGYEIPDNKTYQRLFKAAKRYAEMFRNGKWGYYSKQKQNEIITNLVLSEY